MSRVRPAAASRILMRTIRWPYSKRQLKRRFIASVPSLKKKSECDPSGLVEGREAGADADARRMIDTRRDDAKSKASRSHAQLDRGRKRMRICLALI
jgi:hypothetical protein